MDIDTKRMFELLLLPVCVAVSVALLLGAGSWFMRVDAATKGFEVHTQSHLGKDLRILQKLDDIKETQSDIREDVGEIRGWIDAQED